MGKISVPGAGRGKEDTGRSGYCLWSDGNGEPK